MVAQEVLVKATHVITLIACLQSNTIFPAVFQSGMKTKVLNLTLLRAGLVRSFIACLSSSLRYDTL